MFCHPFISYAKEDRAIAERLYNDLRNLGARPWLDVYELRGGEPWREAVATALRNSTHVVMLISASSVTKSGFVQAEVRLALELLASVPPGKVFIVPVRLDESTPLHERLNDLHWIDLFPNYFAALSQIADSLELTFEKGTAPDDRLTADLVLTNPRLGRAILNPKLFDTLGVSLRLAFVTSGRNQRGKEFIATSNASLECVTTLGQYDLVFVHLGESEDHFRNELYPLISPSGAALSLIASLPWFAVTKTHKYHGFPATHRDVARPDPATLKQLTNAADGAISFGTLEYAWLRAEYILSVEPFRVRKGVVDAYTLVTLSTADGDASEVLMQRLLHQFVLPDRRVFSAYEGSGHGTISKVRLVLRMRSTPEELFEFVNNLHYRGDNLGLTIYTNTCMVVATELSRLYDNIASHQRRGSVF